MRHVNFYIVPGLWLTNGQIVFSQAPTIYALGQGLTLGDDLTLIGTNDTQMLFLDASTLNIAEGQLNYKNLDPNQNDTQIQQRSA